MKRTLLIKKKDACYAFSFGHRRVQCKCTLTDNITFILVIVVIEDWLRREVELNNAVDLLAVVGTAHPTTYRLTASVNAVNAIQSDIQIISL
jgi:hypothetical protein